MDRRSKRWGKIMLAGLAPLIGLWAMGATLGANVEASQQRQVSPASLQQLFQPMVASLLLFAAEHASTDSAAGRPTSQAVLALQALSATLFAGSLFLLRSQQAVPLHARRHSPVSLRC